MVDARDSFLYFYNAKVVRGLEVKQLMARFETAMAAEMIKTASITVLKAKVDARVHPSPCPGCGSTKGNRPKLGRCWRHCLLQPL